MPGPRPSSTTTSEIRLCFHRLAHALILALSGTCPVHAEAPSIIWRLGDGKGAMIADAVVSLHPLDGATPGEAADRPRRTVEISQQDLMFAPPVTVIRVGESVLFPNRDSVQHHVYSLSKPKRFELPLYGNEESKLVRFDQPGVVLLGCNIHDWMQCHLVILDTPYFAKTDPGGEARLEEVPPGRYRSEVWHPRLAKPLVGELAVEAGTPVAVQELVLKLRPERGTRAAPGRRYP